MTPTKAEAKHGSDYGYGVSEAKIIPEADLCKSKASLAEGIKRTVSTDSVPLTPALRHRQLKRFDVNGSIVSLCSISKSNQKEHNMIENKENQDKDKNVFNFSIFRNLSYILLCLNNVFYIFGIYMVFVHFAAYALTIGYSSAKASILISCIGTGNLLGRIVFGLLASMPCFSDTGLYVVIFLLSSFDIALISFVKNFIFLCCIGVVFGFLYGGTCTVLPQVIIKILDVSLLVSGYGYLLLFEATGALSSPPIAGKLKTVSVMI